MTNVVDSYRAGRPYDPALDGPEIVKVRAFAALSEEKSLLEARLNEVREDLKALNADLCEQFALAGVDSMKVDGRIVFLRRQLWASVQAPPGADPGAKEAAYQVLKDHQLGWMVKEGVNSQTLSAWVRELEEESGGYEEMIANMPADLREVLKISEVYQVSSRKS